MASIGENIRDARKAAHMTQVELAQRTKLSRSYIGDIEKDRYNPSVATLQSIADATHVPVEQLLGGQTISDSNNTGTDTPKVIKGDPVSEIFDDSDLRSLARRNFAGMSSQEADAKKKNIKRVVRALFDDDDDE